MPGDQIKLSQGERHRLVGLADYGVVAEIWQHTDEVPSNEEDIIRVQDDYGTWSKWDTKEIFALPNFQPYSIIVSISETQIRYNNLTNNNIQIIKKSETILIQPSRSQTPHYGNNSTPTQT